MTTAAGKPRIRVFLLSDYFTTRKDYYLVATDAHDAIEKGMQALPSYIGDGEELFESTRVQEERTVLVLKRKTPQSGQLTQVHLLPTREAEGTDAFYGYAIEDEEISTLESTYPQSDWQLDGY